MGIYFDHNSTSPLTPKVKEFLQGEALDLFANPSSEHEAGKAVEDVIEGDRRFIAEAVAVDKNQVTFTSGGTEAINTVMNPSKFPFGTVITSRLEHHAILEAVDRTRVAGAKVEYVDNNSDGLIDFSHLKQLCARNPNSLVSVLWVNNETGVIQNIPEIVSIAHQQGCKVHLDAVQALGKVQINLEELGVDFASFSGHKIGSLKGVGFLFHREPVPALIVGGSQEAGLRAGTTNTTGIRSLRLALEDSNLGSDYLKNLRDRFEAKVKGLRGVTINCEAADRCPNTSNIRIESIPNQALLGILSKNGIYVSTGSACTAGVTDPSHVIQALGHSKGYAAECLRFSFGVSNTESEIDRAAAKIDEILSR